MNEITQRIVRANNEISQTFKKKGSPKQGFVLCLFLFAEVVDQVAKNAKGMLRNV